MKALIVIDMQNDFITGSLGSEQGKKIVPAVASRVAIAVKNGEEVILTKDTHLNNYPSTQEGRNLPVIHCQEGTPGWEIAPEIAAAAKSGRVILKRDCFGSGELIGILRELAKSEKGEGLEVEICGLCTEICVIVCALMIRGELPETRVTVDPKLTAGLSQKGYEAAIEVMRACQIGIL